MRSTITGVLLLCLAAAGCGSGGDRPPPGVPRHEEDSTTVMLQRYAGPDGRLTRAQLEEGLRKDFDAADTNHSGVLEPDEARAVNEQRWNADHSAVSPLQDWNGDGVIDFNEFAAGARALFRELDLDHNGVLTPEELRSSRTQPNPGAGNGQEGGQGGSPEGRRGGHRGGRDGGG